MKKVFVIMMLILCFFIITGCTHKKEENKKEEEVKPYIDIVKNISEYSFSSQIMCPGLNDDILYFDYNPTYNKGWFVTTNYDAYYFYNYQLYSNDTNCIKTDQKVSNIIKSIRDYKYDTHMFLNLNYKFTEITDEGKVVELDNILPCKSNDYECRNENEHYWKAVWQVLDSHGITKIQRTPATLGITGKDNNIYGFYLDAVAMDENNEVANGDWSYYFPMLDYVEVVYSVPGDEIIKDFYITPASKFKWDGKDDDYYSILDNDLYNNFIVTDKAFYRYKILDDRCTQYVDIECEYGMVKDEEFTKVKDDILYYDEFTIILSNGRIFSNDDYYGGI